jgi:hypothetical protein
MLSVATRISSRANIPSTLSRFSKVWFTMETPRHRAMLRWTTIRSAPSKYSVRNIVRRGVHANGGVDSVWSQVAWRSEVEVLVT